MRLLDYLSREDISQARFARALGVGSPAVSRYVSGERMPTARVLLKIARVTDGAVTANDFVPLRVIKLSEPPRRPRHKRVNGRRRKG